MNTHGTLQAMKHKCPKCGHRFEDNKQAGYALRWLIQPKTGGLYFNVNEANGRFSFCAPFTPYAAGIGVDARYSAQRVNGTIAELGMNLTKMDARIASAYRKWRDSFAREHPDQYNAILNA